MTNRRDLEIMRMAGSLIVLTSLLLAACGERETSATRAVESSEEAGASEADARRITLTREAVQAVGIEVSTAGPGRLSEVLTVYGAIAPNAERVRTVTARFPGIARSVAKRVGETVRAGEVLASVESNDSLEAYPIPAPIAGVVTERQINSGETVGDRALFVVADLSTVWCDLALFPHDVARVKVGQDVRVSSVDGALTGAGRISWISVLGDTANQSIKARVVLDNANRQWTPGVFVNADIVLNESEIPLAVDAGAVQTLDGQAVVFVAEGSEFEPRPVRLARSDTRIVEILSGLAAGETYVSANSYVLKAQLEKGVAEDEDE